MGMQAVLGWSKGKSHNFDAGVGIYWNGGGPMNFGAVVVYNHEGALHADTETCSRDTLSKVLAVIAENLVGPALAAAGIPVERISLVDCSGENARKPPFRSLKGDFTLKVELSDGREVAIRFVKPSEDKPFAVVSDTAPELVHAAFACLGRTAIIPYRPHWCHPVVED